MKRAVVTGVCGFTGHHLVPLLVARGYEIHGLTPESAIEPMPGLAKLHVVDLTDSQGMADAIALARPDIVLHLGGISFVVGDAAPMYSVNLIGTRNLLEALAGLDQAPSAVLLASSANVYGNTGGVLEETTPVAPANDYAVSKLAMEYLAKLYEPRLPVIVCRPFNYTGVGQSETFLLPKIVAHLRRNAASIELGNLDVARDLSDVRDLVAAYVRIVETPAAVGKTLNVCSGRAWTLREIVAMAIDVSGRTLDVRVNPQFVRANEVKVLQGSRARLDALLGDTDSLIPLHETLRWMFEAAALPDHAR